MTITDSNRAMFSIETGDTVEFRDGTRGVVADYRDFDNGRMFRVIRCDNGDSAIMKASELKLIEKFASRAPYTAANGQMYLHY